ncbi:MAG TPA: alpha/beta fold hydrolase [Candidatus Binataceae bacterium]|nr:alpha/beta fold hydrolase [Candidatus Binataceae bacterium]
MDLIHTAYEPAGSGPHPAISAFHGWGANALDLLGLAPYIAEGRCIVVCPQGPIEVAIGPTRGFGWYQIRTGGAHDPAVLEATSRAGAAFIDAAMERYPIDPRKLILLGFSQGGSMAYRLAMTNPARFAAMVAISTWFAPELKELATDRDALTRLPTLIQHGRADEMVEIARARASVDHLRELKIPVTFREYDCGHEITAESLDDLSQFLMQKVVQPILTV